MREARLFLERICEQYNLCPKFCHLQEGVNECSHFIIKTCEGICNGNEEVKIYNEKVTNAICDIVTESQDVILKEKGRHENEEAFIIIKNGIYLGYGFIDKSEQITHQDQLEHYLIKQKDNSDVQGILRSVLLK